MIDALDLARRLVNIPSVTGDEAAVTGWLGGELERLGYQVEWIATAPQRHNLFATTGSAPRIVFSTHLDTVPPHVPARVVLTSNAFLYID